MAGRRGGVCFQVNFTAAIILIGLAFFVGLGFGLWANSEGMDEDGDE